MLGGGRPPQRWSPGRYKRRWLRRRRNYFRIESGKHLEFSHSYYYCCCCYPSRLPRCTRAWSHPFFPLWTEFLRIYIFQLFIARSVSEIVFHICCFWSLPCPLIINCFLLFGTIFSIHVRDPDINKYVFIIFFIFPPSCSQQKLLERFKTIYYHIIKTFDPQNRNEHYYILITSPQAFSPVINNRLNV